MDALRILILRQLTAAWRHRWKGVLCAWVICVGGWFATYTIPNQYEASARLYVDADAVLTPLLRGLAVDNTLGGQLDVLQRTLLSRPNLEKLVSKTDLDLSTNGPADLERLVERLAIDIKITPQTRNLFTIVYRNSKPKLAYDVVQTVLTTFIESKTGNNRSEMENAQLFLQQQIDTYERQLREAEKRRADFRSKYVDLLPSGIDGNGSTRLEAAQTATHELQGKLADALERRETINKELAGTPPLLVAESDAEGNAVTGGGGGGGPSPALLEAERTLQSLRTKYTDQHPDVIAQRNLVAALKANPGPSPAAPSQPRGPAHTRSVANPVYEKLKVAAVENDSAISSLQRQVADATHERDQLQEIARTVPGLQAEYLNTNRDYDVLRKNYDELLARRESMRIATAAEADADKIKMQIVDPPQVPQNPVAPNRILMLTGVLAIGLGGGIGLALLLAQFDQSFHSTDDLRVFGLPVIGGVSMLAVVTSLRDRLVAIGSFSVATLLLVVAYGGLLWRLMHAAAVA